MESQDRVPRVVIVGAGFGGLAAARRLKRAAVEVVLVDRHGYHLFQPLLYQVATAVLSPGEIAPPVRSILRRQENASVVLGEVTSFDPTEHRLLLTGVDGAPRQLGYDYLVVAAGAQDSYFGHDDWAPHLFPMKTIDRAIALRTRILGAYELAREADDAGRAAWMTFVIVGGGPTGVELAGQLATIAHQLQRDFHNIDTMRARVILVDGGSTVLAGFAPKLRAAARRALVRMGVQVQLDRMAVGVDDSGIDVRAGKEGPIERLTARTVIWAAGVEASPLGRLLGEATGAEVDRKGRVKVEEDCTLPGHPEIFAIGDMVDLQGLPGLCEPAMQEGWFVARTIRHRVSHQPELGAFRYHDMGTAATIGAGQAVAESFGIKLSGLPGKFVWAFIHILFLVGFGNRIAVLLRWLWGIFARNRGERVILGDVPAATAPPKVAAPSKVDASAARQEAEERGTGGRETGATQDGQGPPEAEARRPLPGTEFAELEIEREMKHAAMAEQGGEHPGLRPLDARLRLGRSYIPVWWFLPFLIVGAAVAITVAKLVYASAPGQTFLAAFPAVPPLPQLAAGEPAFMRWTHLFNFFFLIMIVRAGLQILADHPRLYTKIHCTPDTEWLRFRGSVPRHRLWTAKDDAITLTPLVGLPGGRHTIGIARHWHFIFDILFVVNGAVFIVLAFVTGYWKWLIPTNWSIFPDAVSCLLTYTSLHHVSGPNAFFHLNALQQLTYFAVIYILGPLAVLTGLAMSPALDNRFTWYQRIFGNRQLARSLHFLIMLAFVAFYAVHMIMVLLEPNFAVNLNHITLGINQDSFDGFAIFALVMVIVIAFNVWATRASWSHTRVLQRISNLTVGRLMDLLLDRYAPRAEYGKQDVSPYFWPNGLIPTSKEWLDLKEGGFEEYRLRVRGLVEHPVELSLEEIQALAKRQQITMHNCIQGWSGIAEWGGLPFQALIDLVRPRPEAEWVMFYSFGEGGEGGQYYDSHSMHDLGHPQSLLAYEMNGAPLPVVHGAPLRLRVENQLGFKHVKWIKEIEFVHRFSERFSGQGGYNEDHEFYGYRDEI